MTPELDIDKLEGLAKRATPGARKSLINGTVRIGTKNLCAVTPGGSGGNMLEQEEYRKANADFIAACDRETILSLIERLRVAEERVESLANGYESGMGSTKGKEFTVMLHYSNMADGELAWAAIMDMVDEGIAAIARKEEND